MDLNRTTTTSLFALARAISAFSSFLSLSLSFDRFAFWLPRDAEDEEADAGGAGGFSLRSSLMMSTDICPYIHIRRSVVVCAHKRKKKR